MPRRACPRLVCACRFSVPITRIRWALAPTLRFVIAAPAGSNEIVPFEQLRRSAVKQQSPAQCIALVELHPRKLQHLRGVRSVYNTDTTATSARSLSRIDLMPHDLRVHNSYSTRSYKPNSPKTTPTRCFKEKESQTHCSRKVKPREHDNVQLQ